MSTSDPHTGNIPEAAFSPAVTVGPWTWAAAPEGYLNNGLAAVAKDVDKGQVLQ